MERIRMDVQSLSPAVATFLARLKAECIPRIERATVAFYCIENEQVKRDRTGVLYTLGGHHFILTASQCLGKIIQDQMPIFLDCGDRNTQPIPITDSLVHFTEVKGRDVAALEVSTEVAQRLRPHKEFLTHADVRWNDKDSNSVYLLFGYPGLWSRLVSESSVVSYGLAYLSLPYHGEVNCDGFDQNVHVFLSLDQNALSIDEQVAQQLPRLKGVSGCGIWRIAEFAGGGIRQCPPDHACLVALQHRWHPQRKYVQGTWLGYCLALIREKYPDVSAAMDLVYPAGW